MLEKKLLSRVSSRIFGIRDFKAKRGSDSGLKLLESLSFSYTANGKRQIQVEDFSK